MINLNTLEKGSVLWQPGTRRMGDYHLSTANSYLVEKVIKDGKVFFLTLKDNDGDVFTVAMWSHTGFIDAFFDNELDAIKSDVLNKVGDMNRDLMVPERRFKRYAYAFILLTFGILTYIAFK